MGLERLKSKVLILTTRGPRYRRKTSTARLSSAEWTSLDVLLLSFPVRAARGRAAGKQRARRIAREPMRVPGGRDVRQTPAIVGDSRDVELCV